MTISGGTTEFRLVPSAEEALRKAGVTLEAEAPATALTGDASGVAVSVKTGSITPQPFKGAITYGAGGFRFSDEQGKTLTFTDAEADLGAGTSTALVNGDAKNRIPLGGYVADPTNVRVDTGKLAISGTGLKMAPSAAVAINLAFGKEIFRGGDALFDYSSSLTTTTP